MFMMVDYVREMIGKKSSKYGEYLLCEHTVSVHIDNIYMDLSNDTYWSISVDARPPYMAKAYS